MATDAPMQETLSTRDVDEQLAAYRVRTIAHDVPLLRWLMPLASLKLTVVLMMAAIFLVFAGTMAQVDIDIEQVKKLFFRTPLAWIDLQIFFPQSFTGTRWNVPGGFYFPGGWLIGGAMGVNLLAAHALRFKIQAKGARLIAGLAVIALGCMLTWVVVVGGSGKDTIESAEQLEWSTLWTAMKWTLVVLWGAAGFTLWQLDRSRKLERWLLVGFEIVLGALVLFLFTMGDQASLGDSSMRILWQLIKGGLAGLVLLAGCVFVFRKRAGIVLLHGGIALVMANELVVHNLHSESQMQLTEGQTVDYAYDIREIELAVVDPSDPKSDQVVAVPQWMIEERPTIRDEALPFDIEVVKYLKNSALVRPKEGDKNPATQGVGLEIEAEPRPAGTGTDAGGKVDMSAAYVKLLKKGSKDALGTYLVGIGVPDQKVEVGDKAYELAMRFRREYKPYSVTLDDVRADMYLGTNTPKNYSSDIRLVDKSKNVDRDVHIWMNNPLRYEGETFYQTSYDPGSGGREITVLSVVRNTGWMIPYVACMLVGTGMLAHFSIALMRFMRRRDQQDMAAIVRSSRKRNAAAAGPSLIGQLVPLAVVGVIGLSVISMAWPRPLPTTQMKLDEFGRLPVVYDGRVKPLDSLARGTLKNLSGRETFKDASGKKQPAIKWFVDTIADPAEARKDPVIQIYNLDLLETLGLKRREGFRYSIDEFASKLPEISKQAQQASQLDPSELTIYQKKLLELVRKLETVRRFELSFEPLQIRKEHIKEDLTATVQQLQGLAQMSLPLVVPPTAAGQPWDFFASGEFENFKSKVLGKEPNPATMALDRILAAYAAGDTEKFNGELARYQSWLAKDGPADYNEQRVSFEEFYNAFSPLFWACFLYLAAFVLAALGWLGWTAPLNRTSYWMILLAYGLHTFGLIARIYISGRPPVTNLYSSAVFIAWGGVALGLVLERIYRLGIGNVVASVAGFLGLSVAIFGLDDGSDTLGVMQAVLDTQFWLATHVVCITLGYATTFIAGLLGIVYILRGVLTPSLTPEVGKDLSRMIYGVLCFAIFFSFVGTVLGGLWADDSWGRFWGWDPKENGALMIVLWNALVLHARWGGMVKERGLAALAVAGNIVVGWSYFGVNELGVGLHSYGFTEGVLLMLGLFIATQLGIIALAMVPKNRWWSSRVGPAV